MFLYISVITTDVRFPCDHYRFNSESPQHFQDVSYGARTPSRNYHSKCSQTDSLLNSRLIYLQQSLVYLSTVPTRENIIQEEKSKMMFKMFKENESGRREKASKSFNYTVYIYSNQMHICITIITQ